MGALVLPSSLLLHPKDPLIKANFPRRHIFYEDYSSGKDEKCQTYPMNRKVTFVLYAVNTQRKGKYFWEKAAEVKKVKVSPSSSYFRY